MSEVIANVNIEQLEVEDWLKITNAAPWCGVLWKNLMSWATGADETSATELCENIPWLPLEADAALLNEEENTLFQQWRAAIWNRICALVPGRVPETSP
jgi:hypothetical protein